MEHSVESEIESEQHYVDRVYARLDELVRRTEEFGQQGRERGTLSYTGEIKEEDHTHLFERDVLVDHAVRRLALLDAQRDGLVFGRLDRRGGAIRYVGRLGIRDEEQEPLVLDWRAPAAAVFYQATAVRPMDVVRRRVLRSLGQRVVGIEDDLLDPDDPVAASVTVVGDGALMAALSAARGRRMRDIVATIQQEQDEIIRAPSSGATLISGGPGTGKTVVALHRTAYLLYTERDRMARGGVLVVGPSPVFMSYIERVLPSLGEHDATLRSIGEVHDGVVATRVDPFEVAVLKGSSRIRQVLTRAVRDRPADAPEMLRLYVAGETLRLDRGELEAIRRRLSSRTARPNPARRDAVRQLTEALWAKRFASSDGNSGATSDGYEDFAEELREHDDFVAFVEAWWPITTPAEVFERLRSPESLTRYAKGVFRTEEVRLLTDSFAEPANGDRPEWSVADVPLLDELDALLGPPPPPLRPPEPESYEGVFDEFVGEVHTVADRLAGSLGPDGATAAGSAGRSGPPEQYDRYAHVLVDESQDLSPMQWRMLARRGARASWTIVGDPVQSSWPDQREAEQAREAALGKRPRRDFRLSTNYRNSSEIFELAHRVIRQQVSELDLPKAVRTTGVEPKLVTDTVDRLPEVFVRELRAMLTEVEGTVGVVAVSERLEQVRSWVQQSGELASRVSVVEPLATKGLEYDGVLVIEPAQIAEENAAGARTLYVVLTRATQRLTTISSRPWPGDRG